MSKEIKIDGSYPTHIMPAQPGRLAVVGDSDGTILHYPLEGWVVEVFGREGVFARPIISGYWPHEYYMVGVVLDTGEVDCSDGRFSLEDFAKHCRQGLAA